MKDEPAVVFKVYPLTCSTNTKNGTLLLLLKSSIFTIFPLIPVVTPQWTVTGVSGASGGPVTAPVTQVTRCAQGTVTYPPRPTAVTNAQRSTTPRAVRPSLMRPSATPSLVQVQWNLILKLFRQWAYPGIKTTFFSAKMYTLIIIIGFKTETTQNLDRFGLNRV